MSANMNKEAKPSYFKNVRSEMKKVAWPGKKDVINYTTVVIVMCAIAAVAIGAMDFVFKALFNVLA